MIKIATITTSQRDLLVNIGLIQDFGIFSPIQDINNNYFISENEYYYCLGLWYLDELQTELEFITTLILSEYFPKINETLI